MAHKNKNLVGLLNASATIGGFKFDEKKFLNGLTEKKFDEITSKINDKKDYENSTQRYKDIINCLREEEKTKESGEHTAYHGAIEDVLFHVYALFVEYDMQFKKTAEKFENLELPFARGSSACNLLTVDLGYTDIRKDVSAGQCMSSVGSIKGLDPKTSKKLHEIIFSSLDYGSIVRGYGMPGTISYEIGVNEHEIDESSVRYRKQGAINIGEGHATLAKLSFDVNAKIQYLFMPCRDNMTFEEVLRKFDLREF